MLALNFFLICLFKNSFSLNTLLLKNARIKESSFYYNYSNVLNSTSYYSILHNYTAKKTVFITGATGVMGQATLNEFVKHLDEFKLKLLILPNKESKKVINKYIKKYGKENFEIIWGDLLNYDDVLNGVKGSDYVLHIGGLVSPMADAYPYLTQKVNVDSAKNIVKAILAQPNKDEIKVCYIGSVAETGNRNYPIHWGRTGDPIKVSIYDHYGLSKVLAERVFVESGIRTFVKPI